MMSSNKGVPASPESDRLFKWAGIGHGRPVVKLSLEFLSGHPPSAPGWSSFSLLAPQCGQPGLEGQMAHLLWGSDLCGLHSMPIRGTGRPISLNTQASVLWKPSRLLRSICKEMYYSKSPAERSDLCLVASPWLLVDAPFRWSVLSFMSVLDSVSRAMVVWFGLPSVF